MRNGARRRRGADVRRVAAGYDPRMAEQPDREHLRPDGASDAAVEAAGTMSEALETLERARGHLYTFHQLIGETDFALDEVLELLRECGAAELEERIRTDLLGRNVVPGHWTFQLVEAFDDTYWEVFRAHERAVREALTGGRRHVYESELKERRRTHGRPGHEARADCRLKCSVVANVAADPRRAPRLSASAAWAGAVATPLCSFALMART